MRYEYILHEKAQEDYEQSLLWYKSKSQQAAENFVTAIDDTLLLICEHPFRWRNRYKNFYELGLKKYPFVIIYKIEADKNRVIVSAIFHCKRNPSKKYRKI